MDPGHLTKRGRIDQLRIGAARRREYVVEKKFLSENYNPREIFSIATFVQRCVESGRHYLEGLYPLEKVKFQEQFHHFEKENSPLAGTIFETMLKDIESRYQKCMAGPIIDLHQ